MKIDLVKASFLLMIAGLLFTAYLVKMGFLAGPSISIAYFFSIPFMVAAIVELNNSDRIDRKGKTMWTFGFVALTLITGILYFLSERKDVIPEKRG